MASEEKGASESPSPSTPGSIGSQWRETILLPTILAGLVGGAAGLLSKNRAPQGVGSLPAVYAANFSIVAASYTGAREFVRANRPLKPDDILNSVAGGMMSGALLGRIQGGQFGAIRYSILFAAAGTMVDFSMIKVRPVLQQYKETISRDLKWPSDWKKMPDWSPIQILDPEALAKKRAREQQLHTQRSLGELNKEES